MDWEIAFEYWPVPLFVIDPQGDFVHRNRAFSALAPLAAEGLVQSLEDPPENILSCFRDSGPLLPDPIQTLVRFKSGPSCELSLTPLPDSDLILGLLTPASGGEERSSRELDQGFMVLRQLGHDICQPLTVIMGQTELMQMIHSDDEDMGRRLEAILSEAEKIEAMTRDLSNTVKRLQKV